jgi:hypothetical protein
MPDVQALRFPSYGPVDMFSFLGTTGSENQRRWLEEPEAAAKIADFERQSELSSRADNFLSENNNNEGAYIDIIPLWNPYID